MNRYTEAGVDITTFFNSISITAANARRALKEGRPSEIGDAVNSIEKDMETVRQWAEREWKEIGE